jgi:hypothetical protein
MVAAGRLSPDEAVELLTALGTEQAGNPGDGPGLDRDRELDRDRGPRMGPVGPVGPGGPAGPVGAVGPIGARVPVPPVPPVPPRRLDPPRRLVHTLHFDVRNGNKRVMASLPIGLVGNRERFLPRQVREGLAESDIDLEQLLDLIASSEGQLPGHDGTLLDIRDEDENKRIIVSVS